MDINRLIPESLLEQNLTYSKKWHIIGSKTIVYVDNTNMLIFTLQRRIISVKRDQ